MSKNQSRKEAMMKFAKLLVLTAFLVIFTGAEKVDVETPEGVSIASGDITQGSLRLLTDDGKTLELPLEHTDVDAHVSGYIARVNVTQHFTNPYKDPIEAVYVFPLPENAAVDGMTMKIGDKVIKGVIKKREEAREIYEAAIEAGQTASLLEQERPNIFTQTVGNIMPGDDIYIEITYVQDLKYDHGTYEYVFPMVVGPRFIPGARNTSTDKQGGGWSEDTDKVPDASRITPPVLKPEYRSGHDISLKLTVDAGVPIQNFECPSHDIAQKVISETQVEAAIKKGDQIPNKDFIFRYDVAGKRPEYALLTHATGPNDGYFMLMIQPQAEMKIAEITPKEMIFVVDCSGSMSGFPIEKAKEAMRLCIENMNPDDYFNVIKFSDQANGFSQKPVPNTPDNVKKGLAFVDAMEGTGGTMMIEGIKYSLDGPRDPKRRRVVLFMTDGYIGNETEILAAIEDKLGNARLFSFGVGSSVNRYLLENMAEVGRGQVTYCRHDEDPQAKVELFYERIAKPYLMDIEIDWGGLEVTEVFPQRIPDLFSAQPVIIHGRYTKPGSATIKVTGKVRGKPVTQEIPVVFPATQSEHDVIATLWARTKIEYLSDQMYHGSDQDIVDEITQLALRYKLMSQYTSFVAVSEEIRNVDGKLETVQVPIPMPEGVSYEGVFGEECESNVGYGGALKAPSSAMHLNGGSGGKRTRAEQSTGETFITADKPADRDNGVEGFIEFETPTILGALTADQVTAILDAAEEDLVDIYEKYLAKDASIEGRAVFGITVKPDGGVEAVVVKTSTLDNENLEKALVKELGKLRFTAPSDGGKVIITIAMEFET
jgi:Ca-activated chloride channel family protein